LKNLLLFIFTIIITYSCKNKDSIPEPLPFSIANTPNEPLEPLFDIPSHFPHLSFPTENEQTRNIVALGRMLFYDPILSKDSSISCASCHFQHLAFTDSKSISIGIEGKTGFRNSPPLFNLAWHSTFFWDGGAPDLESQAIAPITTPEEMGHNLQILNTQLNKNTFYKQKFKDAFGTDSVFTLRIITALAMFQKSIISGNSAYDAYLKGNTDALNQTEKEGMLVYEQKCSSCHKGVLMTDFSFQNNGLDEVFSDLGRGRITDNELDNGKFKVPTLRNVALTAPFMHDGRFFTLDEVLEHYATGKKNSSTVAASVMEITLSVEEKNSLKHFLNTLTDYSLLTNKKFSKP
jgi:cytochrome c peroxidase